MNPSAAPLAVALLGVGHTHAEIVRRWARTPLPGCRLVCVSRFDRSTYSGMLPGALAGQCSASDMEIPLAPLVERAGGELLLANVVGIDHDARALLFDDRKPVGFDLLSIGVGSIPEGTDAHAESPAWVPVKPMQTFLSRLEERVHAASAPARVAVVGGGAAGIEIAFALHARWGEEVAVELFTGSDRLGEELGENARSRVEALLLRRGIPVHVGHRVSHVGADRLETEAGTRHAADAVVWATGAVAPPVLGTLGLPTDSRGFVSTRPTLQAVSDPRIFAVGDSGTPVESAHAKAGVYAVRQGPVLWHNLQVLASEAVRERETGRAAEGGARLRAFEPQSSFLRLLNTGEGRALLSWRGFTVHARWCWWLKNAIDRTFLRRYR